MSDTAASPGPAARPPPAALTVDAFIRTVLAQTPPQAATAVAPTDAPRPPPATEDDELCAAAAEAECWWRFTPGSASAAPVPVEGVAAPAAADALLVLRVCRAPAAAPAPRTLPVRIVEHPQAAAPPTAPTAGAEIHVLCGPAAPAGVRDAAHRSAAALCAALAAPGAPAALAPLLAWRPLVLGAPARVVQGQEVPEQREQEHDTGARLLHVNTRGAVPVGEPAASCPAAPRDAGDLEPCRIGAVARTRCRSAIMSVPDPLPAPCSPVFLTDTAKQTVSSISVLSGGPPSAQPPPPQPVPPAPAAAASATTTTTTTTTTTAASGNAPTSSSPSEPKRRAGRRGALPPLRVHPPRLQSAPEGTSGTGAGGLGGAAGAPGVRPADSPRHLTPGRHRHTGPEALFIEHGESDRSNALSSRRNTRSLVLLPRLSLLSDPPSTSTTTTIAASADSSRGSGRGSSTDRGCVGAEDDDEDGGGEDNSRRYRAIVSQIDDGLFVSGEEGAHNVCELRRLHVGSIVNVAERACGACGACGGARAADMRYLTVDLLDDGAREDLRPLFLPIIDVIERGRARGTGTLLHCQQGISRSATFAVGYEMWKRGLGFRAAMDYVAARRPVISPNGGFLGQLVLWGALVRDARDAPADAAPRLLRVVLHRGVRHQPFFVAQDVAVVSRRSLDARGCFLLHVPAQRLCYCWVGTASTPQLRAGAAAVAQQMARYLWVARVVDVRQSWEPLPFWRDLRDDMGAVATVREFDRDYAPRRRDVVYRFPAWDPVDLPPPPAALARPVADEALRQVWVMLHVPPPSAPSSSSDAGSSSSSSAPQPCILVWVPPGPFYVRVAPDTDTDDRDTIVRHVAAEFASVCALPPATPVRAVASIAEFCAARAAAATSSSSSSSSSSSPPPP